jgi:hypothetical protein
VINLKHLKLSKLKIFRILNNDWAAIFFIIPVALLFSLLIFREDWSGLLRNGIPLAGDGLLTGLYLISLKESSFISIIFQNIQSANFGWPGQLQFISFPIGNTQEALVLKIFMEITNIVDPARIIHFFAIFKAVPIVIATYILSRTLNIPKYLSIFVSLGFTFSNFNLVRSEGHFLLGLSWSVPLGLAALYICFTYCISRQKLNGADKAKVIILVLCSFISSYYYTIFFIIIGFFFLLFLIYRNITIDESNTRQKNKNRIFHGLGPQFLYLSMFSAGLLIQTVPVLYNSQKIAKLTGLGDRGAAESIIYSGNADSLIFDLNSLILRIIGKPELSGYFYSKISWEASQIGSLTGLFIVLSIVFLVLKLISNLANGKLVMLNLESKFKNQIMFSALLMIFALILYIGSPVNFGISNVIPQIRAWGRISLIITLASFLLIVLFFLQANASKLIKSMILILCLLLPVLDSFSFRNVRPDSDALNQSNVRKKIQLSSSFDYLKSEFTKGCSLVNLPIYPFPEFDIPNDNNIDYAHLELPLVNSRYFQWSYGGIKSTENFSPWQQLVSEYPPFYRANLNNQILYASKMGACGAVIDVSYLVPAEILELNKIINAFSPCVRALPGPNFDNRSRYYSINFKEKTCNERLGRANNLALVNNPETDLTWRIDQPISLEFKSDWQLFDPETPISVRTYVKSNVNKSDVILSVRVADSMNSIQESEVCIFRKDQSDSLCKEINFNSNGIANVSISDFIIKDKIDKFSVSLDLHSKESVKNWGIKINLKN